MKTKTFNVKDESIRKFIKENFVNLKRESFDNRSPNLEIADISPYHVMKDKIYLKKGIVPHGEKIIIELNDFGANSKEPLTNKYTYVAKSYDDIADEYELVNFEIVVVKEK